MAQAPPKAGAKDLLYSLNLIHEFTSLFSPKVIFAGLPGKVFPRKQSFVNISGILWLRKQRPRFAQGQPKGYFQTKELHRRTQAIAHMNADWKMEKAQYAEFNVPTCGKIAVWLLWCSFPWQKLLAGAKRSVVQSKFDPWVYILVSVEGKFCRFAWESLPTEARVCRHQCFSVVAQAMAKIRPRPAQGLFSNERTS